jgi:hypothetical protein
METAKRHCIKEKVVEGERKEDELRPAMAAPK